MTKQVRYSTPAPVTGGALGGALRGFANFANSKAAKNVLTEERAYEAEKKDRDYLANYITAMAQQDRAMTGDQPAWLNDAQFEDAPQDNTQALAGQKLANLQDPAYQKKQDQMALVGHLARGGMDMDDVYEALGQVGQGDLFQKPYDMDNPPTPKFEGEPLGQREAEFFIQMAGGDKKKAKELADASGFDSPDIPGEY